MVFEEVMGRGPGSQAILSRMPQTVPPSALPVATESSHQESTPAAPDKPADLSFAGLGLSTALSQAAASAGWLRPTPVQSAVVPAILLGRDVLAQAPTGSGKTASFVLPILHRLLLTPGVDQERPRRLAALVLVPTRELAAQIAAAAQALAPRLKTVAVVGGLSINPQMMALRGGAHIVVATPGRLLDLTRQNALRLADLSVVVLDEADRLLDAGFADEIRRVLALLPRPRQTLMFSATLPESVRMAARASQSQALEVTVEAQPQVAPASVVDGVDSSSDLPSEVVEDGAFDHTALATIEQRAIVVETQLRTPLLRHLISTHRWPRTLVFVATQHASEHVADKLRQAGLSAAALHGQLSQGRRAQVLADLQAGLLQVMVATDLAARGLDVPALDAVVNLDLPRSAADYTHRIGRTGRAGAAGVAVSFVLADAPGSEAHFRLIEKRQRLRVPREVLAGFEPPQVLPAVPADPSGGIKGRRLSKKDKLRAAAGRA